MKLNAFRGDVTVDDDGTVQFLSISWAVVNGVDNELERTAFVCIDNDDDVVKIFGDDFRRNEYFGGNVDVVV